MAPTELKTDVAARNSTSGSIAEKLVEQIS
jgi:hypothetical protein